MATHLNERRKAQDFFKKWDYGEVDVVYEKLDISDVYYPLSDTKRR